MGSILPSNPETFPRGFARGRPCKSHHPRTGPLETGHDLWFTFAVPDPNSTSQVQFPQKCLPIKSEGSLV